jgi:hypothetical protein
MGLWMLGLLASCGQDGEHHNDAGREYGNEYPNCETKDAQNRNCRQADNQSKDS